jgi:hypothetical protein
VLPEGFLANHGPQEIDAVPLDHDVHSRTMNWPNLLALAVSLALAALIAFLVVGTSKRVRYVLVLFVFFVGLKYLANQTFLPRVQRWQLDRQLRELPFYREIAQVDPVVYEQIEAVAWDSATKGEGADELTRRLDPIATKVFPKYINVGSDEAVATLVDVTIRRVEELHRAHSDACYYALFPLERGHAAIFIDADETTGDESLEAMGRVVLSAIRSPQAPPDAAKAEALLAPVIVRLRADYGNDLLLGQQKPPDSAGRLKVCQIATALFRDVESLPRSDAGIVLRYVFANQWSQSNPEAQRRTPSK